MTNEVSMSADVNTFNKYRNLRQIKRCNTLLTLVPEDVAQHSYYVALLAYRLASEYNTVATNYNLQFHPYNIEDTLRIVKVEDCVIRALYHDIEEVFISDIPWDVKHHNSQVNTSIRQVLKEKLQKVYEDCKYINEDENLMFMSKMGTAGLVVNLADMLEGACYCVEELQLGNKALYPIYEKYLELIQESPIHKWLTGGGGDEYKSQFYIDFIKYIFSMKE